MRGTTLVGMLLYEASVKSDIKNLVDGIDNLTMDEIDSVEVPLPWFRKALRELKEGKIREQQEARVLANVISGEVPEEAGFMVQWNGEPIFVRVSKAQMEITEGTPVLLLPNGGMWIGSTYCSESDFRLLVVSPKRKMTRGEYLDFYQKRLNDLY